MRGSWCLTGMLGALGALAVAANSCSIDCTEDGQCGGTGAVPPDGGSTPDSTQPFLDGASDATTASDTFDGSDGVTCDPNSTPQQNACVISEAYAVFVAPNDASTGAGTRTSPLNSIDAAITLASAESDGGVPKRVYACAGTYAEAIAIDASRDGVQVFGGFDCATWSYTGAKAVLSQSAKTTALTIRSVTHARFADLEIDAPDAPATQPTTAGALGASSIGVFVANSTGVLFERCTISAGAGQPGQDQAASSPFSGAAPDGQAGSRNAPGAQTPNPDCPASIGGTGGGPGVGGNDGSDGTPGPSNKDTVANCVGGLSAMPGANGSSGMLGAGATAFGRLDATGWTPAAGQPGGPGGIGQGGGGGASVDQNGGGGSGAAGGCGGAGGGAGTGGGSSLAIAAFESSVDLEHCSLSASSAGRGGNGASGQVGQSGGAKGNGFGRACQGGNGGYGGSGGGGGGGAGGVSAGILWSGNTAPTIDGVSVPQAATNAGVVRLGAYGAAGQHGTGAAAPATGANAGQDGTDGKAGNGTPLAIVQLQ